MSVGKFSEVKWFGAVPTVTHLLLLSVSGSIMLSLRQCPQFLITDRNTYPEPRADSGTAIIPETSLQV